MWCGAWTCEEERKKWYFHETNQMIPSAMFDKILGKGGKLVEIWNSSFKHT